MKVERLTYEVVLAAAVWDAGFCYSNLRLCSTPTISSDGGFLCPEDRKVFKKYISCFLVKFFSPQCKNLIT